MIHNLIIVGNFCFLFLHVHDTRLILYNILVLVGVGSFLKFISLQSENHRDSRRFDILKAKFNQFDANILKGEIDGAKW